MSPKIRQEKNGSEVEEGADGDWTTSEGVVAL
jgi:hypothetical protein